MIETIAGISVLAIIVGLTELVKKYNYLNERLIPLVPFVFTALLLLLQIGEISVGLYVMSTLMYGLIANGLYSATKKIIKG